METSVSLFVLAMLVSREKSLEPVGKASSSICVFFFFTHTLAPLGVSHEP